jgi:hypothetical protein
LGRFAKWPFAAVGRGDQEQNPIQLLHITVVGLAFGVMIDRLQVAVLGKQPVKDPRPNLVQTADRGLIDRPLN